MTTTPGPTGPTGPIRPLTDAQQRVANLVGRGFDAKQVAQRLNLDVSTIRNHVHAIAGMMRNPDDIAPYRLVMLWAAHERWLKERDSEPKQVA